MNNIEKNYPDIASKSFKALGTDIDVRIVIENEQEELLAQNDLAAIELNYELWEKKFSRFDLGSELSHLNQSLGEFLPASLEMQNICGSALDYYEKSQGYFDPRIIETLENVGYDKDFENINDSNIINGDNKFSYTGNLGKDLLISGENVKFERCMDFSGIVKGWVTDQISEFLKNKNWKNFLIDSGGDMFLAGRDEKANPWYIDIEGISHEKILFELSGVGIATTGIGKRKWEKEGLRFHHLINPKNPENFAFDLKSVTVIAGSTQKADVYAKTIFVMGLEKGKLFAEEKGLPCVILDYRGNAYVSPTIKEYLFK